MVTIKDLEAFFGNGWNGHDVDSLMTFMSDDCVFEGTAGREVCGTRYEGRERVREAFAKVFSIFPDGPLRSGAPFHRRKPGCVRVGLHRLDGRR